MVINDDALCIVSQSQLTEQPMIQNPVVSGLR
jgi:hypothetical protein